MDVLCRCKFNFWNNNQKSVKETSFERKMDDLPCSLCNNKTVFYLRNFAKLKSKHSKTPVHIFLRIICGDDDFISSASAVVDDENSDSEQYTICVECMQKIDDYDAACITKERIEREFRIKLQHSREIHGNVESCMNLVPVKTECIEDVANTPSDCEYLPNSQDTEIKTDDWEKSMASPCSEHEVNDNRYICECDIFVPAANTRLFRAYSKYDCIRFKLLSFNV